jgi:hypothetical protein
MNHTTNPINAEIDGAWPGHDSNMPVADTSLRPQPDGLAPPAVDLLYRAVQQAHDTIDHLADSAAPTVRQLGESVAGAEASLQAQAHHLRETGQAWTEGLRDTVRGNPLLALAAALLAGALISYIAPKALKASPSSTRETS